MILLKFCSQYINKFENSAVAIGMEKVSFHSNPKKKVMPKNVQTTIQLGLFHMVAR